jgi:hypothetical protein
VPIPRISMAPSGPGDIIRFSIPGREHRASP